LKSYLKIVLSMLFTTQIISAASISGFVKDSTNGEPLPYANIYVDKQPYGTTTNFKGFYLLDGLPAGEYKIITSYVGYKPKSHNVVLKKDDEYWYNVNLYPAPEVGEEIVVTAHRDIGERSILTGRILLQSKQIQKLPQIAEPDLFRSMHLLPGVTTTSDFSSALYIWGGTPSQNLITIDGIDIYNVNHLGGVFSAFNVDAIKEVNLIKGGFPAKWGGRIGSVIEVVNKEGDRYNLHGSAAISLLSSRAMVEGPIKDLGSWMFSARRTYIDVVTSCMDKWGIIEDHLPYYFTDVHGKVTFDLPKADKLMLSAYYGRDNFDIEEDDPEEEEEIKLAWGNWTFSANYLHLLSNTHFGNFLLAYSQSDDVFHSENSEFLNDIVRDLTLKADLNTAIGKHEIEYGGMIKFMRIKNRADILEEGGRIWKWDNSSVLLAGYGQDEYRFTPLWRLGTGLRWEYCGSGGYNRISPRLYIQRTIDEKSRAKFSIGRYYQFFQTVPKFEELGLSLFDTWVMVDDKIKPTWANHFVLRAETEHLNFAPISVDLYYKQMGDILRHKRFFTENFTKMFESGSGESFGVDFMARVNHRNWNGWVSYSLGYAVYKFDDFANGEPFYPKHDKRHQVNIYLSRKFGRGWYLSATWVFTSGMPYTEPIGKYWMPWIDEDWIDPGFGQIEFYYGGYNNRRVPAYHRLDLAISHRSKHKLANIEWYFQILNVYNRKNIYAYTFEESIDENEYDKDEISMFPLLPTFGLNIEF